MTCSSGITQAMKNLDLVNEVGKIVTKKGERMRESACVCVLCFFFLV